MQCIESCSDGFLLLLSVFGDPFGQPYLEPTMICVTFHCVGKYSFSKKALNNGIIYFIPIIGNSLRNLPVMRS
jgi:hypothetical protein